YPLGLILVEIDSDLDTVRSHIDRLAIDNSIITKSGSCKLSTNWPIAHKAHTYILTSEFHSAPAATTAERFFRIDKSQESLHYITDISSEDLYLLDPEFVLRTGGNELPTTVDTAQQQQQVVDDDTSPTKAELEISATGLKETQKELDDADYRCSRTNRRPPLKRRLRRSAARQQRRSEPGSPDTSVTVQTDQQQPTTPPSPQPPSVEVARQAGSILASRSALSKALIDACKRGCLDKMRALRDKGADLGAADSAGMTCLHHATRFGYRDIVAYLVEHGPPQLLDQADLEKGQTALHKASWYQRRQICQLLVQAGASLTVVDSAGLTPRQQACKADDKDLAQWLEGQEHTQLVRKENQETTVGKKSNPSNQCFFIAFLISINRCRCASVVNCFRGARNAPPPPLGPVSAAKPGTSMPTEEPRCLASWQAWCATASTKSSASSSSRSDTSSSSSSVGSSCLARSASWRGSTCLRVGVGVNVSGGQAGRRSGSGGRSGGRGNDGGARRRGCNICSNSLRLRYGQLTGCSQMGLLLLLLLHLGGADLRHVVPVNDLGAVARAACRSQHSHGRGSAGDRHGDWHGDAALDS
uniref:ANK_REP_REGION domain-containing protein n=1 Tax=Macrostomum lignano TaxID=282301 RepID=A0A1I8HJV8_9PLAT